MGTGGLLTHPSLAVFEHNLVRYRRVWRGSVFSSFLLPVLFLLGMGLSVGAYVDARGAIAVEYLDYIAPGLLASTALQVAANESSWPVLSAFQWNRTYHAMRASPLRVGDILAGQLTFVLFRVMLSAVGFLAVMVAFGTVHSVGAVLTVPICLLTALAVAAPVFAFSASITNDGMFAVLLRFGIVPMTLFAGVFFPVESLPLIPRWLAHASPLWHAVELCRAATLGDATAWGWPVHVGYLALWCALGLWLAQARFVKRLTD